MEKHLAVYSNAGENGEKVQRKFYFKWKGAMRNFFKIQRSDPEYNSENIY